MDDLILSLRGVALRAARALCRRLPRSAGVTAEEAEAAALVALWRELLRCGGVAPPPGRLAYRLRLRLVDWLRAEGRFGRGGAPRYEAVQTSQLGPDAARRALDLSARDDPALAAVDDRDEVDALLRRFLPAERELLRLHYLEGLTLAEAGRRQGRGHPALSKRLARLARECGGPAR